jgi:hypothetical protein
MAGVLEISFNSPQCGWMSIGFEDGIAEFHTTTAHAPHQYALPELMDAMARLVGPGEESREYTLRWNRDPEEYDFRFVREGDGFVIQIFEYPNDERELADRRLVFEHQGQVADVYDAFRATFDQLYEDRDTDEFEFNWRQPFPHKEYERFSAALADDPHNPR